MIKWWAKILPYFVLEWYIKKFCTRQVFVLKGNPYQIWNNDGSIGASDLESWNAYEFSPYCKLIVSDKDAITKKIEKKEREICKLKSELVEL